MALTEFRDISSDQQETDEENADTRIDVLVVLLKRSSAKLDFLSIPCNNKFPNHMISRYQRMLTSANEVMSCKLNTLLSAQSGASCCNSVTILSLYKAHKISDRCL